MVVALADGPVELSGDEVELRVDKLGSLRHRIGKPKSRTRLKYERG